MVALDPAKKGRWKATLVARDARTGKQKWTRPVHSTFGPQRCGPYVCLSEHTALASARVVVLDPDSGKQLWKLPGIAEVEWSEPDRVVVLRLAAHPMLESASSRPASCSGSSRSSRRSARASTCRAGGPSARPATT